MAVSRRLRYEVLRRDNHTCRYCGATAPDVKLTVDHVTAKALGGKDEASNLVTACGPCNSGKSSTTADSPLVEDVAADALRWAHARTLVLDEWRQKRRALAVDLDEFAEAWDGWTYGSDENRRTVPRDSGWQDSVERWLTEGLDVEDLIRLIPKAMHNKTGRNTRPIAIEARWTYYCGVVWRTLDDIADRTKARCDEDEDDDQAPGAVDIGTAYHAGYTAALGWALQFAPPVGQVPYPCLNCPDYAYGETGYCLRCWIDGCDPDIESCRGCRVLFHIVDVDQRDTDLPRCERCNDADIRPEGADLEPF